MQSLLFWTLLYFLTKELHDTVALPVFDYCRRLPLWGGPPKTPGDNGYRIRLEGNEAPGVYTPEHVYTVTIDSTMTNVTFQGFMLVCVPRYAKDDSVSIGTFQLMSPMTTNLATKCPDVIAEFMTSQQTSASVLWTAPPTGTGCLEFRATVIYTDDLWFKDEGALVKILCEKEINHKYLAEDQYLDKQNSEEIEISIS